MKFEIEDVNVIYPDEESGESRKLEIETNDESLRFNFIDKSKRTGSMFLNKKQVELLRDTLNIVLKNKLIES